MVRQEQLWITTRNICGAINTEHKIPTLHNAIKINLQPVAADWFYQWQRCNRYYIHPPPPLTVCLPAPTSHGPTSYWLPLPTSPSNTTYPTGIYTLYIMSLTFFILLPMKMELIRSSETSAIKTQTPGNYQKGTYCNWNTAKAWKQERRKSYTCY